MPNDNLHDGVIPKHVAFIMDGNRRWAKRLGYSIPKGHTKGLETLENLIEPSVKKGIKYLTFYSFSTENWNRTKTEVSALLKLMSKALKNKTESLKNKGAKVKIIGSLNKLPQELQNGFRNLEEETKGNKKIHIAFAISYGGKQEILDAVNKVKNDNITEEEITKNLYAPEFPEPELIVRTGGQKRLSGFLLWQSTYSELYFTDTLWPDFNDVELDSALNFYAKVKRNFGK